MAQARFGAPAGARITLVAALVAALLVLSPAGAQTAMAAGPLRVEAHTTYTVDPAATRIHVAIAYTLTNNKPNSATFIYYYRTFNLGIQPAARNVRASDGIGAIGASTTAHKGFTEVAIRLRANLYHGRTTSFTLRYDLLGGAPRSNLPSRVGKAFVTFGVWAFGDRGLGTVEVRMPSGFTTTIDGGPMTTKTSPSGNVAKASPTVPDEFYAVVTGESSAAYEYERLALGGGVNLAVLAWPEDDKWSDSVTSTLRDGMPKLVELIGLEWPVAKDLKVTERYTPSLEGYAGLFFVEDERIDVSEDLDPATIVHEASHAWLNEHLFTDRWVYEGLAEEYAWQVLTATGGDAQRLPDKPTATAQGRQPLLAWSFPQAIRDQDTSDEEQYGYKASFWLLHTIVEEAGLDQMRKAFAAAQSNVTAYPGAGTAETVPAPDNWHRFLDLVEPLDAPDSPVIEQAVRDVVTTTLEAQTLGVRTKTREAYRELLAAGGGWLPPWYVRQPMGSWLFPSATERIEEATAFLGLRDQVEAAATAEGLALDGKLEGLYESASDGFDDATALANRQRDAIAAIADAHAKVDSPGDLFAQIGLLGGDSPRGAYDAARAAFDAGDLAGAVAQAGVAVAIVTRAPTMGQERVIMAAIVLAALVAFLLFVAVVRRRRARQAAALAITPGSPALLALDAHLAEPSELAAVRPAPPPSDATEPSGTLGGHSDVPPSLLGEAPASDEGGSPP